MIDRRPQEGRDHLRRRERLVDRGRGLHLLPPGGGRGVRDRRARREVGRGGEGARRARARRNATEQDIIDHCRSRLAHYKCPKSVEFRDELARTATGKLQKFKLRAPYWEGQRAPGELTRPQPAARCEPSRLSHPARTIAVPVAPALVSTAYGRPAVAALHAQIVAAKRDEPLAPVTVVVPTNSVGVATRRLLASGELGPITARGVGRRRRELPDGLPAGRAARRTGAGRRRSAARVDARRRRRRASVPSQRRRGCSRRWPSTRRPRKRWPPCTASSSDLDEPELDAPGPAERAAREVVRIHRSVRAPARRFLVRRARPHGARPPSSSSRRAARVDEFGVVIVVSAATAHAACVASRCAPCGDGDAEWR